MSLSTMKNIRFSLSIFLFLSVYYTYGQEITEFAMCKKIADLQPQGITKHYQPGERAYAWMKIEGAEMGSQIMIDWYAEDQLTHTSKLTISTEPSMRTYAYKTLYMKGIWKIIVRKADNTILKEINITVGGEVKDNE